MYTYIYFCFRGLNEKEKKTESVSEHLCERVSACVCEVLSRGGFGYHGLCENNMQVKASDSSVEGGEK